MEIATIFAAGKAALELAKKAGNLDLSAKIIEMQEKSIELVAENDRLRKENDALKESSKVLGELTYKNDAYWEPDGTGPFCSRCVDKDRVKIRMIKKGFESRRTCPACDTSAKTHPEAQEQSVRLIPHRENYN